MIITRMSDTVDFQLSESRRVNIDVGQVASAALAIERRADGRLSVALELLLGTHLAAQRIEAGLEQLTVMHARIVEMMLETRGPASSGSQPAATHNADLPY